MRRLVMKMSRSKEGDPDFDQEASFLTIFFFGRVADIFYPSWGCLFAGYLELKGNNRRALRDNTCDEKKHKKKQKP